MPGGTRGVTVIVRVKKDYILASHRDIRVTVTFLLAGERRNAGADDKL